MSEIIKTPHIEARAGDFAKTVLMPGDPLRAKFVAENFLENPRLVNNIRGIQGYTGTYQGKAVSVMGSGMGMPSIAIYSYELYKFFGVENIIRIGSAGALADSLKLGDVLFAMSASTNSAFGEQYGVRGHIAPTASYELLRYAVEEAEALGVGYSVGSVLSSDVFYSPPGDAQAWASVGTLAVEMEASALYLNASRLGKRALAILTVSDHIIKGDALDAHARQTSFTDMMKIALGVAIKY